MVFDPLYLLFVLPGVGLSLWASGRVKSSFTKYSKVRTARGFTGAQAAQELLRGAGITDVKIVRSAVRDWRESLMPKAARWRRR